ncbi:MAG: hypothetical protein IKJ03_01400 [Mycoplasmataceae bacterium]|nr:hypothetical protein [Mycoplasmataceae bacterium]
MWNIIKFLDIYVNENPSQSIEIDNQNTGSTPESIILLLIVCLIAIIIFFIFYILDLKKNNSNKK